MKFGLSNLLWLTLVVALSIVLVMQIYRARTELKPEAIDWDKLCQTYYSIEVRTGDAEAIWLLSEPQQQQDMLEWLEQHLEDPDRLPNGELARAIRYDYVISIYLDHTIRVQFSTSFSNVKDRREFEAIFKN